MEKQIIIESLFPEIANLFGDRMNICYLRTQGTCKLTIKNPSSQNYLKNSIELYRKSEYNKEQEAQTMLSPVTSLIFFGCLYQKKSGAGG